jgi:hypothetical protein
MLRDLLTANRDLRASTLVHAHFGTEHAQGLDVLEDLVASGLVARSDEEKCSLGAKILLDVPALADLLCTPEPAVPTEPGFLSDAVGQIFEIENQLRSVLIHALSSQDEAWWVTRVPATLAGEAESRRQSEADLIGGGEPGLHPVMYLGLGELFHIIFERANWDEVFRLIFPTDLGGAQVAVKVLLAVRNRAAHSRPIGSDHMSQLHRSAATLGLLR